MYHRYGLFGGLSQSAKKLTAVSIGLTAILFCNSIAWGQCNYVPGDANGSGIVTGTDITYLVNYFKGLYFPPLECPCPSDMFYVAADVNGSCSVTMADVTRFVLYFKGVIPSISYCPNCPPSGPAVAIGNSEPTVLDVGVGDSIIVGKLNGSVIRANPGDTINIPIWAKNDEAVSSLCIAVATDDQHISQRLGGNLMSPLTSWAYCDFLSPIADTPVPGFTTQSLTGWHDLGFGSHPFLNTNGAYAQIGGFRVVIDSDPSNIGDTAQLIVGNQPRIGEPTFSDSAGTDDWDIITLFTIILITGGGCDYLPGDINGSGSANGIDVTYGVTYLKNGSAPPDSCDCPPMAFPFYAAMDVNGSCSTNGIDITFFVSYLKNAQPELLYCEDCPALGRVARENGLMPAKATE